MHTAGLALISGDVDEDEDWEDEEWEEDSVKEDEAKAGDSEVFHCAVSNAVAAPAWGDSSPALLAL